MLDATLLHCHSCRHAITSGVVGQPIGCVVSLCTGLFPPQQQQSAGLLRTMRGAASLLVDTEAVLCPCSVASSEHPCCLPVLEWFAACLQVHSLLEDLLTPTPTEYVRLNPEVPHLKQCIECISLTGDARLVMLLDALVELNVLRITIVLTVVM